MVTKKNIKTLLVLFLVIIFSVTLVSCNTIGFNKAKSAYEIAVDNGFVGTEQEWLYSLSQGKSAYDLAVAFGFIGTEQEWLDSLKGADGLTDIEDIYDAYVANGGLLGFNEFLKYFYSNPRELVVSQLLRSTVTVIAGFTSATSQGTGVIMDLDIVNGNAYIITNLHVIYTNRLSTNIKVALYGQEMYSDFQISATCYAYSDQNDLAILEVTNSDRIKDNDFLKAVEIADSDELQLGEDVIVVGNALGLGISASSGCVSRVSEEIDIQLVTENKIVQRRVLRTDATVNNGNSGGGIFNKHGQLIGIIDAGDLSGDDMNYAIPSNVVSSIYYNFINNGSDAGSRFLMGIMTQVTDIVTTIDPVTDFVNVRDIIKITSVSFAQPAYGKLYSDDQIMEIYIIRNGVTIAGKKIDNDYQITDLMHYTKSTDQVRVVVKRNQVEQSVMLSLNASNGVQFGTVL